MLGGPPLQVTLKVSDLLEFSELGKHLYLWVLCYSGKMQIKIGKGKRHRVQDRPGARSICPPPLQSCGQHFILPTVMYGYIPGALPTREVHPSLSRLLYPPPPPPLHPTPPLFEEYVNMYSWGLVMQTWRAHLFLNQPLQSSN